LATRSLGGKTTLLENALRVAVETGMVE